MASLVKSDCMGIGRSAVRKCSNLEKGRCLRSLEGEDQDGVGVEGLRRQVGVVFVTEFDAESFFLLGAEVCADDVGDFAGGAEAGYDAKFMDAWRGVEIVEDGLGFHAALEVDLAVHFDGEAEAGGEAVGFDAQPGAFVGF